VRLGADAFLIELLCGGDDPRADLLEVRVGLRALDLGGFEAGIEGGSLVDDLLVACNAPGAEGCEANGAEERGEMFEDRAAVQFDAPVTPLLSTLLTVIACQRRDQDTSA